MVDLRWCSFNRSKQLRCAKYIVNIISTCLIVSGWSFPYKETVGQLKTVRKNDKQTSCKHKLAIFSSVVNECHKINTRSRWAKLNTWDRGKMCQAASPRWRPKGEIAWHPERYPGEEEEVISSAMNVSKSPLETRVYVRWSDFSDSAVISIKKYIQYMLLRLILRL